MASPKRTELSFVAVGQSLIKRDTRNRPEPAFRAVAKLIDDADLAFTNLEATIKGSQGGWPTKSAYVGTADAIVLDALKALGFNMLSLSNNHAFDLGPNGVLSTLEEVKRRGFCAAGVGIDQAAAARPGYLDTAVGQVALVAIDGGPSADFYRAKDADKESSARPGINALRVAQEFHVTRDELEMLRRLQDELGHKRLRPHYRHGGGKDTADSIDFYGLKFRLGDKHARIGVPDEKDLARHLAAVAAAAERASFVAVYLHHHHWEAVWEDVPDWERAFARAAIDAGASVYVSHGVPLLQPIEIYHGRPIFYSLGNFIFQTSRATEWHHDDIWRSVVATCRFGADGALQDMTLDPIVIGGEVKIEAKDYSGREVPWRANQQSSEQILKRLAGLSAKEGTRIEIRGDRGFIG
jgi:poly-gamma-glutamate capsule biosynthesis protein CapA/YwtB (metallophosphatase superfamily)